MGTWNSGRSGVTEHMPRKPVDKSRSPALTRRGCRSLLNGNLCHTASGGEFQRVNASEHYAALRVLGPPQSRMTLWGEEEQRSGADFGPSWPEVA
jgi:hypothetical protein